MHIANHVVRRQSWEDACSDAAAFIGRLRPHQVVSVSHVSESPYGVVFIWYWEESEAERAEREGIVRAVEE